MSNVFEKIIEKLLNTTDRTDGHMNNLRGSAYEAIMEMIKNSPADCYETVLKTTNVVMERINQLIQMEVTTRRSILICDGWGCQIAPGFRGRGGIF